MFLAIKKIIFLLSILAVSGYAEIKSAKVGVLAHRGEDVAKKMWQPTMDYLTNSVNGRKFELVPLDFAGIQNAIKEGGIDFVVVNTGMYVELEQYGISRIATLSNHGPTGCLCNRFGGVFFTRADNKDINTLQDIKGKKFLAVDKSSFGGWLMQLREMKEADVNPDKDIDVKIIGNHEKVVEGVLSKQGDVGSVRTDILERMASEGKINLKDIKVLNKKEEQGFPYLLSTRLYPEWPFCKLKKTDDTLSQYVAIALFEMSEDSPAAKAANIKGWSVPADYNAVHDLYKELKIGPYKDIGKFDLIDVLKKYWFVVLLILAFIVHLTGSLAKVRRMHKVIQNEKQALEETHAKLDRTNSLLMESIRYARKIQEASLPDKHALDGAIDDIFVCWEPLHVVGGDYFWLEKNGPFCIIVAADCTGHGVPGAFMTMIAASALHRAIKDLKMTSPADILTTIDETVRQKLRQDYPDTTSDDGLDCAICIYNTHTKILTYSGANLPLLYIENGELNELKPTRASLGYKSIKPKEPFIDSMLQVKQGMSFYMLTDGIPDHMGQETRRLLGKKRLGGIILENQHLSMIEQMQKIEAALDNYRGNEPRRDDMTLIGFKPIA